MSNSSMEFYRLLPPNLQNNQTKALAVALDNQYQKLLEFSELLKIYSDIDKADERVCDIIAKSFRIIVYDTTLPVEAKRSLVKAGLKAFYNAGTMSAINDVLKDIHGDLMAEEWYKYGGEPFTFKAVLDIKDIPLYDDVYKAIRKAIETYKAARTHLEGLSVRHKDSIRNKNKAQLKAFHVLASASNFYVNIPKFNGLYPLDGVVDMSAVCEKGLKLSKFTVSSGVKNNLCAQAHAFRNIRMDGVYRFGGKIRMNGGYENI